MNPEEEIVIQDEELTTCTESGIIFNKKVTNVVF